MPRINVKLDDVESQFELYPEGTYLVRIEESSRAKKSSDGGAYIGWIGTILEGEYEGKKLYWMTSLQPQALWNLKNMLEVIDVPWDEDGFELEDTFGRELFVDVTVETYQGEQRNYVNGYHKVA